MFIIRMGHESSTQKFGCQEHQPPPLLRVTLRQSPFVPHK